MTITSCGPRSGIGDNQKEDGVCGVKDPTLADTNNIVPQNESQLNGKNLFMVHCRQCHAPMDIQPCMGKSLKGSLDRLPKTGDYFKTFVQNSDSVKKSGDPYANKIDAENKVDYEHNFKTILTEKEIKDIEEYVKLQ